MLTTDEWNRMQAAACRRLWWAVILQSILDVGTIQHVGSGRYAKTVRPLTRAQLQQWLDSAPGEDVLERAGIGATRALKKRILAAAKEPRDPDARRLLRIMPPGPKPETNTAHDHIGHSERTTAARPVSVPVAPWEQKAEGAVDKNHK